MNSHQEIYVKENIIENNVPLHNVEYNEIKKNGHPLYIQGHVNDKTFSYIHPILRKDTYDESSKGKIHKDKRKKKKTVRFRRKLSSTENVGMPMLLPSQQEKITSKKKRKSTRKHKKSSTSNKLKKNTFIHE